MKIFRMDTGTDFIINPQQLLGATFVRFFTQFQPPYQTLVIVLQIDRTEHVVQKLDTYEIDRKIELLTSSIQYEQRNQHGTYNCMNTYKSSRINLIQKLESEKLTWFSRLFGTKALDEKIDSLKNELKEEDFRSKQQQDRIEGLKIALDVAKEEKNLCIKEFEDRVTSYNERLIELISRVGY